jgi:uridine kinase
VEVLRGLDAIEAVALAAATAELPPNMPCKVVAIDGPGGAGKSTLAARVSRRLSDAPIVHTDDFASWSNPMDWWPRLLEQVLLPLTHRRPARYQRYDWDAEELAEWHTVVGHDYLIIEGVTASRRAFRPYLALSVWVVTAREECLRRGLERDGEEELQAWRDWQVAEDAYIASEHPESSADLVVSGEGGRPWTGPGRPDETTEP